MMDITAIAKLAARLKVLEETAAGCIEELEQIVGLPLGSVMAGARVKEAMVIHLSDEAMARFREVSEEGEVRRFRITDLESPMGDRAVQGECHLEGGRIVIDRLEPIDA